MKALIGKKIGMTQLFSDSGAMVPVTLVQAGPCTVTQIRSSDKDGYQAVQLGYGEVKKLSKALAGHFKKSAAKPKVVKEFRIEDEQPAKDAQAGETAETDVRVGDKLDVSLFEVGETVAISGTSKGKGFAGTIKRYNFHRGPKTHGSRNYRRPGSIGSMYPQNIWKGKKMAGQMGNDKVTLKNVTIAEIDQDQQLLALKGAVPGARGGYVIIQGTN